MARFRAYTSDSSSSESSEDEEHSQPQPKRMPTTSTASRSDSGSEEEESESGSEQSDSVMDEDELAVAPGHDDASDDEMLTGPPPNPHLTSFAQSVGMDGARMNVMQASLFPAPPLSRKHSRDSDGLISDKEPRSTFANLASKNDARPARKYIRTVPPPPPPPQPKQTTKIALPIEVPPSESIYHAHGDVYHILSDAGLSFGRAFRATWGPRSSLVSPSSSFASVAVSKPLQRSQLNPESSELVRSTILPHFLKHSPIVPDYERVPVADPNPAQLTFASIAALFPPSPSQITRLSSPAAEQKRKWIRSLFLLASALFDPFPPSKKPRTLLQQQLSRKKQLSKFLSSALPPYMAAGSETADVIYRLLAAHRISQAADLAADAGFPRLALLIAHAGSTDASFRSEVKDQLRIWREERVIEQIEPGVRRCYALLSGDIEELISEGVFEDLSSPSPREKQEQPRGWINVFGVLMWFVLPLSATIADVFAAYEDLLDSQGQEIAHPLPPYLSSSPASISREREDPHYALIRLFADPSTTLSDVLHPLNFTEDPLDVSLPWVLSILFSRVHNVRDFADREQLESSRAKGLSFGKDGRLFGAASSLVENDDNEEERVLGHSPSASLLTASYVAQLSARGDSLQESVFVALFGEASAGRKRVIKGLLQKEGGKELTDEWVLRGLIGSLKLGMDWIAEAKALFFYSQNQMFDAYVNYLDAARRTSKSPADFKPNLHLAHSIATTYLAPEAVLHSDLDLLKSLFDVFSPYKESLSDEWIRGGQIYLNYVQVMTDSKRLAGLLDDDEEEELEADGTRRRVRRVEDAVVKRDREDLRSKCSRLIGIIPDLLGLGGEERERREVVVRKMGKELVEVLMMVGGPKETLKTSVIAQSTDEATRLNVLRDGVGARFMRSVGAQ